MLHDWCDSVATKDFEVLWRYRNRLEAFNDFDKSSWLTNRESCPYVVVDGLRDIGN